MRTLGKPLETSLASLRAINRTIADLTRKEYPSISVNTDGQLETLNASQLAEEVGGSEKLIGSLMGQMAAHAEAVVDQVVNTNAPNGAPVSDSDWNLIAAGLAFSGGQPHSFIDEGQVGRQMVNRMFDLGGKLIPLANVKKEQAAERLQQAGQILGEGKSMSTLKRIGYSADIRRLNTPKEKLEAISAGARVAIEKRLTNLAGTVKDISDNPIFPPQENIS